MKSNIDDVLIIKSWLSGSDFEKAMFELAEAEKELETVKKKVSSIKKKLAKSMLD